MSLRHLRKRAANSLSLLGFREASIERLMSSPISCISWRLLELNLVSTNHNHYRSPIVRCISYTDASSYNLPKGLGLYYRTAFTSLSTMSQEQHAQSPASATYHTSKGRQPRQRERHLWREQRSSYPPLSPAGSHERSEYHIQDLELQDHDTTLAVIS